MKVSVEEMCTVIRKPFDARLVREQLNMGNSVVAHDGSHRLFITWCRQEDFYIVMSGIREDGERFQYADSTIKETITTLPPLPSHPKPEDAPLLYRYVSENLHPSGVKNIIWKGHLWANQHASNFGTWIGPTITHALLNGERVEIAIAD